ncbi:MAG TPA: hypothetical protein VEK86_03550 [Gemmatimonadales bacterium]|nr:hypothetical protein [Gemmatimonadales bacterium]
MRRVTPGLALLRATGMAALLLLLWNPATTRPLATGIQPIVLLDASLSMAAGPWRAALDTARALGGGARRNAIVWRFGAGVAAFDTTPPADGASDLAPALEAAAGRGGEVIVVTDGAVSDVAAIPPDLLRRPRVIVLPRAPFRDAFVAAIEGQRRLTRTDTLRLKVSYGTAGKPDTGNGKRAATLTASVGGRRVASKVVELPDSGVLATELTSPVSRFPPGWSVLDLRLEGVSDPEPRDDARRFVIEVSAQPAAVIFASPPDWETRFLARTLGDVARVPVRTFVETEPDRWRDAATLAPVAPAALARAAAGARLVVLGGEPERARRFAGGAAAQLVWPTVRGQPGDWYVERPPASPLAGALAGILWDSLPPAVTVGDASPTSARPDSGVMTALTARLARRGTPRPIVTLDARGGTRRATVTAAGLWRWAFRGGASEEAYRGLVAALADWLLGERRAGRGERAVPTTLETPNGLPLVWRWTGEGGAEPRPLAIDLAGERGPRTDTLRFDAAGRAELRVAPGVYRYALAGGPERGVVAVEEYSAEWRPSPAVPALAAQPGQPEGRVRRVGLRDRWWLYVLVIAAFVAEWAWRRRQGLP